MVEAVRRCAPVAVSVLARKGDLIPEDTDRETLAGQAILIAAQAACSEAWGDEDLERRAEAKIMECIAGDIEGFRAGTARERQAPAQSAGSAGLQPQVLRALEALDTLRLQVLALIVQEDLSIPEAALVLGLPEWRVHQECAAAVGQIRRQVFGAGEDTEYAAPELLPAVVAQPARDEPAPYNADVGRGFMPRRAGAGGEG